MKILRTALLAFVTLCVGTSMWAQAPAPAKTAPQAGKAGAKPAAPADAGGPQVDINTASASELKAIPGIGDKYAAKIMAGRPYKTKAQLKSRNILPDGVYEKVKDRMVAKQK